MSRQSGLIIFTCSSPGQCEQHGDNARGDVALKQRRDRAVHNQHRHGRTVLRPLHVNHRIILGAWLPPGGHFEVRVDNISADTKMESIMTPRGLSIHE